MFLFIFLYCVRVFIRDIVQPISEVPSLFPLFERSQEYGQIMTWQAYIFDFFDFIVGMITLHLFYRSGQLKA